LDGTASAGSGIVAGAMGSPAANAGAMGSSTVGGAAVGANSGPSAAISVGAQSSESWVHQPAILLNG